MTETSHELCIVYWRCNHTRQIRVMRDACDPGSVVGAVTPRGKELTEADVRRAERLRDKLEKNDET